VAIYQHTSTKQPNNMGDLFSERLVIRTVKFLQERFSFLRSEVPTNALPPGTMRVNYPHAPLRHTLLAIILEALWINHESTNHVPQERSTCFNYWGIKIIREPINQLAILLLQLIVREQKLAPHMFRYKACAMGHISQNRNSRRGIYNNGIN
jgi:hypothetical protein